MAKANIGLGLGLLCESFERLGACSYVCSGSNKKSHPLPCLTPPPPPLPIPHCQLASCYFALNCSCRRQINSSAKLAPEFKGKETREGELQGCSLSEMRVASTGGKLGVQATSSATAAAASNAASGDASVGAASSSLSLSHSPPRSHFHFHSSVFTFAARARH